MRNRDLRRLRLEKQERVHSSEDWPVLDPLDPQEFNDFHQARYVAQVEQMHRENAGGLLGRRNES